MMSLQIGNQRSITLMLAYGATAVSAASWAVMNTHAGPLNVQTVRDYLSVMSLVSLFFFGLATLPRFRATLVAASMLMTFFLAAPAIIGKQSLAETLTLRYLSAVGIQVDTPAE